MSITIKIYLFKKHIKEVKEHTRLKIIIYSCFHLICKYIAANVAQDS